MTVREELMTEERRIQLISNSMIQESDKLDSTPDHIMSKQETEDYDKEYMHQIIKERENIRKAREFEENIDQHKTNKLTIRELK